MSLGANYCNLTQRRSDVAAAADVVVVIIAIS